MIDNEVQFSIYKIDRGLVVNELNDLTDDSSNLEVLNKLITYIECIVKKSELGKDYTEKISFDTFTALYVYSVREPIWKKMIQGIFDDNEMKVYNISSSYLLFTIVDDNIFAMTGGRASHYISKFIEKNFGLYLIPKIIDETNPVLKKIVENNTSGNNLSTQRVNKNATSVLSEEKIRSIYKELSICISTSLAKDLGIELEESKKIISISSGDSFVIKKSLSISDLKKVLKSIVDINKREDNFILNYFVPCEKKRKKAADLDNIMYDTIIENQSNMFEVIAEDVEKYFSSSKYALKLNDESVIELDEEIKFPLIYEYMLEMCKGKITRNFVKNFLKNVTIYTLDSDGNKLIYDKNIYDMLRGCVEIDNESYYFLNGRWYVFEESYFDLLDNSYKKMCLQNEKLFNSSKLERFEIKNINNLSEDKYNNSFKERNDIIVGHKNLIKRIELADLIFWDDNNLFLMCNKSKFNGPGTRDLFNQIETSYVILNQILNYEPDKIELYYNNLKENEKKKISKEKFCDLFKTKKIIYIAGYSSGFSENTSSVYCKYLIKDLYDKVNNNNFGLIIMNYND